MKYSTQGTHRIRRAAVLTLSMGLLSLGSMAGTLPAASNLGTPKQAASGHVRGSPAIVGGFGNSADGCTKNDKTYKVGETTTYEEDVYVNGKTVHKTITVKCTEGGWVYN
jgi:hypothetical protein